MGLSRQIIVLNGVVGDGERWREMEDGRRRLWTVEEGCGRRWISVVVVATAELPQRHDGGRGFLPASDRKK